MNPSTYMYIIYTHKSVSVSVFALILDVCVYTIPIWIVTMDCIVCPYTLCTVHGSYHCKGASYAIVRLYEELSQSACTMYMYIYIHTCTCIYIRTCIHVQCIYTHSYWIMLYTKCIQYTCMNVYLILLKFTKNLLEYNVHIHVSTTLIELCYNVYT